MKSLVLTVSDRQVTITAADIRGLLDEDSETTELRERLRDCNFLREQACEERNGLMAKARHENKEIIGLLREWAEINPMNTTAVDCQRDRTRALLSKLKVIC